MSSIVVVDASIAAKWVVNERHSAEARRLLQSFVDTQTTIAAPPILLSELTQVFNRLVQQNVIEPELSGDVLHDLIAQVNVQSSPGLYERTLAIATTLGFRTSYDAEYLALAEELRAPLWTADLRLYETSKARFPFVRNLTTDAVLAGQH